MREGIKRAPTLKIKANTKVRLHEVLYKMILLVFLFLFFWFLTVYLQNFQSEIDHYSHRLGPQRGKMLTQEILTIEYN